MRCAVTGASGFVGRHLVSALSEAGALVVRLDRSDRSVPPSQISVRGDLSNETALEHLVEGADVVFHLAGYAHQPVADRASEALCYDTNAGGMKRLLRAIAADPGDPFIVYLSSASALIAERGDPGRTRHQRVYGDSKLLAERQLLDGVVRGAFRGCVLRPSKIVGDGAPGNLARMAKLVNRGLLPLVDGGYNLKSLTHVDTVVDACLAVVEQGEISNGQAFVVTDDQPYSMRDIGLWISRALGRHALPIPLPRRPLSGVAWLFDHTIGQLRGPSTSISHTLKVYSETTTFSNREIRDKLGFVVRRPVSEWLAQANLLPNDRAR